MSGEGRPAADAPATTPGDDFLRDMLAGAIAMYAHHGEADEIDAREFLDEAAALIPVVLAFAASESEKATREALNATADGISDTLDRIHMDPDHRIGARWAVRCLRNRALGIKPERADLSPVPQAGNGRQPCPACGAEWGDGHQIGCNE